MTPDSGVFVITPICPHVLTNRSIIVGEDSTIEVEVTEKDYPVFLTVDGRDPMRMKMGSIVTIKKANITSRERGLSSMPEGMATLLSKHDLRDLVEFLSSCK